LGNHKIYDVDDADFNCFLITAGRKWKDFKSTLKAQYFNENLTEEDLKDKHSGRVNDEDWKFLSEYWVSPECEGKTKKPNLVVQRLGYFILGQ
jgi:rubredoxin